jgi:hypothetical protein
MYFHELETHGLEPTSETYAALISAIAASQCMTREQHKKRYLTQPRGWPVIPNLGAPDPNTPDQKVARLEWDVMGGEKGKKFAGFFNDVEERAVEDYKRLAGIKDADDDEDENEDDYFGEGEGEGEGYFGEIEGKSGGEYDEEELVEKSGSSGNGNGLNGPSYKDLRVMDPYNENSEVDDIDSKPDRGLSWRQTIEQQRVEAAVIIAKGEKKRLARENSSDLGDGLEDEVREVLMLVNDLWHLTVSLASTCFSYLADAGQENQRST